VAGVYARTDLLRGFHHTPANQALAQVTGLSTHLSHDQLSWLNPVGINALVASAGRGVLVWGSRTLSSDPDNRYVHRRRVLGFILRSLRKGTSWAIFERPDDLSLRPRIAAQIQQFLHLLWRSGALWGATPDEAFTVDIDDDVETGRVVYVECVVALDRDYSSHFRLAYFCD
jgi:phage tail sheath protein FI